MRTWEARRRAEQPATTETYRPRAYHLERDEDGQEVVVYPTGKTYYLSLEGDGLPEIGNMRCPKGAILLITPLSAGGKIAVEGGAEALGTSSDGGQTYRITGDFLIFSSGGMHSGGSIN